MFLIMFDMFFFNIFDKGIAGKKTLTWNDIFKNLQSYFSKT